MAQGKKYVVSLASPRCQQHSADGPYLTTCDHTWLIKPERYMICALMMCMSTMKLPEEEKSRTVLMKTSCSVFTTVWCQSHIAKPVDMDPVGHGWHVNVKDELCPTMYKNESAPAEVRDVTHLYCTDKSCRGQKCQCVIAGLDCIDICTYGGQCENQRETSVVENDAEVGDFSL